MSFFNWLKNSLSKKKTISKVNASVPETTTFIILSIDKNFINAVQGFFNRHVMNPSFHIRNSIRDVTQFLENTEALRVFIIKSNEPFSEKGLLAINRIIKEDINQNIKVFINQKDSHQSIIKVMNIKTVKYFKENLGLFPYDSVEDILNQLNNY